LFNRIIFGNVLNRPLPGDGSKYQSHYNATASAVDWVVMLFIATIMQSLRDWRRFAPPFALCLSPFAPFPYCKKEDVILIFNHGFFSD
jgi:hypothetical protein